MGRVAHLASHRSNASHVPASRGARFASNAQDSSHRQGSSSSKRHSAAIIGGAVGGAILLLALLFLSLIVYRRLKKSSPRTSPASEQSPVRLRRFRYRELRSATGKFGDSHKLGQGGFGSVYKGTLKNGQEVAVKKLDTASLQGEREFMNELSIVGSISSSSGPHVVGLIGFCADSKRKMLVYEYMANRSLQEALFDEKHRVQLDWEKRMKIVLDVARALAFLHGKCEPPIVHGDVKPSNVLLDADFSAKLADFGLARVKTVQQDLRSEELQRDSLERERIRSQRIARDRERKKKKRLEAAAAAAAAASGSEDHQAARVHHHIVQVDEQGKVQHEEEESKVSADPLSLSTKLKNAEEEDEKNKGLSATSGEEENGGERLSAAAEKAGTEDDEQINKGSPPVLEEQQTDGVQSENKSPASSSMTSPASKQLANEEHKIPRSVATPSSIGGGDDDDEWSKMSQSAYGTEADTWSKISPSEVDCRSEISIDSTGHGQGLKSGMKFLGRKKSWGRKKSTSPSSGKNNSGGRDWWWKQDNSALHGVGEFSIKEYIVDWVSCENRRGRSTTREWPWSSSAGTATAADADCKKKKKQARSGSLEWWAECDDGDDDELARRIKSEQKRKKKLQKQQEKLASSVSRESSRDWWRDQSGGGAVPVSGELCSAEEFSGEIVKNSMKRSMSEESFTFYHSGEFPNTNNNNSSNNNNNNPSLNNSMELLASLSNTGANGRRRVRTRSREWWSGEMQRGKEWWSGELTSSNRRTNNSNLPHGGRLFDTWSRDSLSGELTTTSRRRHHRDRSRSRSRDWWSGDLLSRATTVSSTPSMRGTVCYVAPEYGGGGMLTDKSDVYSFGVLVLVIVSGRRPLQVVASPLSEFERANLISWARHAAQAGRGLDLVDASLGGAFSKEQATLCISLALLCLQRLPALRPTMSEVVKILSGEAELPALPFEFSPSPPGCPFKSRRKTSSEQVSVDVPLLAS